MTRGISSKLNARDIHASYIVVSNSSDRCPVHTIKPGSSFFWTMRHCAWLRSLPGLPMCSRLATSTLLRRRSSPITRGNRPFSFFSSQLLRNHRVIHPRAWMAHRRCIPTTAVTLINADSESRKLGTVRSMPRYTHDTYCPQPLQRSTFSHGSDGVVSQETSMNLLTLVPWRQMPFRH